MHKIGDTKIIIISSDIQNQYSVRLSMPSFGSHEPELDQNPEELFRQGNYESCTPSTNAYI